MNRKMLHFPSSKPALIVDRLPIYTVCKERMYCTDMDLQENPWNGSRYSSEKICCY